MSADATSLLPPTGWNSCLYECSVLHERRVPSRHRFEYGIFMMLVDLDELPLLEDRLWTFGQSRRRMYTFRDSDHLQFPAPAPGSNSGPIPLRKALTAWLAEQGVVIPPDARIRLLTLPRVLGYVFNPVSFYFVHDAQGGPITAVAEVQNTFGELKPYLIPLDASGAEKFRRIAPKEFYVSPFSQLDLNFDFRLQTPGDKLSIGVNDLASDGATHLVSVLTGTRQPLTDASLLRLTARYPLVTLRVITLIHWHALRLWFKRLPWYRKADRTDLQRGVFRPHASLSPAAAVTAVLPPSVP
jgi:DUF1365 family protein